jgi:hypothetical protein
MLFPRMADACFPRCVSKADYRRYRVLAKVPIVQGDQGAIRRRSIHSFLLPPPLIKGWHLSIVE